MDIQKLELVDEQFPALLRGEKTDTIRLNEGDIKPGFLLFYSSSGKERAVVWVTEINYMPLRNVGKKVGYTKRTPDDETCLRHMKKHYPDITLDTEILLVEYLSPSETKEKYFEEVKKILKDAID